MTPPKRLGRWLGGAAGAGGGLYRAVEETALGAYRQAASRLNPQVV